ncbi:MAG: hypothetical protein ACOYJW_00860 [Candidatus Omnitrophota bacterium]
MQVRIKRERLIANIPEELKKQKAWVGFVLKPNGERMDKVPMNVLTGKPAKTNDPETWTDFETALNLADQRGFSGIGFVFSPPYVGIDLDHCVKDGVIAPLAKRVLSQLNSYSEYSPSGTGIHIICRGAIEKASKISTIGLEIYTKGRFFTFTGNRLTDFPADVHDRTNEILSIQREYSETADLLKRIAKSADAEKFDQLFSGNWTGYPSQSEADLALCNKLAFWTGKDAGRMDSIFRQSGLMRSKWNEKHFGDGKTYGEVVIEKAITGCREVFSNAPAQGSIAKPKLTQGEILTRDCEANIKDFFRDQQGAFFVVLPFENHTEVCQTNSTRFRNWMAKNYRAKYGAPPKSDALTQARIQIEARCEDARQVELFNRVGWHDGAIYYDLTTHDWQGVRIDATGWNIVSLPPLFRRHQHQAEQVIPERNGDPREILRFCNISPDDHCLFMATLATFFIPNIPHVILSQNGEQGSGKSNNSRKIKGLGDPSKVMLISTPKDLEQAQMTAEKHWISTFDNISRIHEWFSDFLCRGVTGEGDMKRSLYTNDDEFIRSYRRCFVLNGIGASLWRADLIDRAVIFDIPLLKNSRPEKTMDAEWQKALPGILGGFFTAISKAIKTIPEIIGHEKFRMSDFAQWGAALSEAMGYSREEFFRKYQESVDRKWEETAEENALVNKLVAIIEESGGEWHGSVTALLEKLKPEEGHDKYIPATQKALSSELMRIAPIMRNVGIDVIRVNRREAGTGRKQIILRRKNDRIFDSKEGVNIGVNFCEHEGGFCEHSDPRPF